MVQPTLQEISLKEVHKPFSSSSRGPIHEDRRLQIEELDEWQTHKPKLRQNELNEFPNQLKVGDKVLLDVAVPHIVTTKPNEEIPLTVLPIRYSRNSTKHTGMLMTVWKQGKDFPNTSYDKSPRSCDMAVGEPAKIARA
ncbi:hypothetical protein GOBAR_AA27106 [Gossypium barbadense]|uniref:Uncharacterized protein n=1 Tax=Gossypium barbadense TaxID=3634 RepID=A0A2P5WR86_GOSBA|nr:hypothetical protein GOBAR_AA27106 [Gossypium barbadense]